MKIQHNIPAMNAYRNYTNNVSAVAKNLEKLSSGYRINRAGDDAAGLAISEKMRAQITGLETAQKNAKDGISLIQTAEGAMTEVHSMLNRMFELAEQSANGTYDNEVDRANLQKEFNALRTEINRIADSSNFNGQKLLDGSLNSAFTKVTAGKGIDIAPQAVDQTQPVSNGATILSSKDEQAAKTSFVVELNNLSFLGGVDGDKITLKIGDDSFDVTAKTTPTTANGEVAIGKAYTGADLAGAFVAAINKTGKIANIDVVASLDSNGKLLITQKEMPEKADEVLNASMKMEVSSTIDGAGTTTTPVLCGAGYTASTTAMDAALAGATYGGANPAGKATVDVSALTLSALEGEELAGFTSGETVTFELRANSENYLELWAKGGTSNKELKVATSDKILETLAGADAAPGINSTIYDFGTFGKLTIKGGHDGTATNATITADNIKAAISTGKVISDGKATVDGTPIPGPGGEVTGDHNVGANVINRGSAPTNGRVASTAFSLTADMVKDGETITIGKETYTFKVGADSKVAGTNVVDLSKMDGTEANFMDVAGKELTLAAAGNKVWSVGHDGDGKMTLTEHYDTNKAAPDGMELDTFDKIKASISYGGGSVPGSALTLQIGDTSDDFNMLKVSVGDMHAASLGKYTATTDDAGNTTYTLVAGSSLADVKISEQTDAQGAMDVIKGAINMVSSTRGDLGALQNRLEHTINNLGVMQENIQDAEASIRDTDIAKEMMAYTKNNILVQASQAMLAQANQLPQGVLQLLG